MKIEAQFTYECPKLNCKGREIVKSVTFEADLTDDRTNVTTDKDPGGRFCTFCGAALDVMIEGLLPANRAKVIFRVP